MYVATNELNVYKQTRLATASATYVSTKSVGLAKLEFNILNMSQSGESETPTSLHAQPKRLEQYQ